MTRRFKEPGRLVGRGGEGQLALDAVTLRVERGEIVALVGPNGAGKSTLLRVLATLVLPTTGHARVLGRDVVREPAAVRRSIGVMTADDRSFFWRLTGWENMLFFAGLQGIDRATARPRAGRLLDQLGLAGDAGRRFSNYSTGMRQRLGIARALLHEPGVMLLDEPTANLDARARSVVIETLRSERETREMTALIASHDAGLAAALADRVIRLDAGRVVTADGDRRAVQYVLRVRGIGAELGTALGLRDELDGCGALHVPDLGDGHALAQAIGAVVAGGGEVLDVRQAAVEALP